MAVQFVNGAVLFVGAAVAMHANCCCAEPCPCCIDGLRPNEFRVVLASFTGCCAALNGTYYLTLWSITESTCEWQYTLPTPVVCGDYCADTIRIHMTAIGGGQYRLYVEVYKVSESCGAVYDLSVHFHKDYTGLIDCNGLSSESIPYDGSYCGAVTPTCTMTAV